MGYKFFNVKYFENGTRYTYNDRLIGGHVLPNDGSVVCAIFSYLELPLI